ncbi:efflux RND transporter permease subunit, partial [Puniceibacterium confluentis]|uniref:efflux RND transporter permease subunit n=1 Tax=Puniceibacterium confluentis TaxID=1958944 RepID=UPI0011B5E6AF
VALSSTTSFQCFQTLTKGVHNEQPTPMTSMAFSLGVLPLVLSTGAGSGGRQAIGSGVLGGTISATVLGVLLVPFFFVLIARLSGQSKDKVASPHASPAE